ncbi:hypothetical protein GW17_00022018 [Ensete ventricosum]|nr:hypothetical protein GW17_00022018 [Ensete ventricosum]
MEELSNDSDGGRGSCGRQQQQQRKFRTTAVAEEAANSSCSDGESFEQRRWKLRMTSWAEEALDMSIGGRGRCDPLPRRWKELHMEATTVEGIAHESYTFGLVHQRTKEVSILCIDGGGSDKGSIDHVHRLSKNDRDMVEAKVVLGLLEIVREGARGWVLQK